MQRLCEVLSCYRGGRDVTILGERYGYGYEYGYGKKETTAKGTQECSNAFHISCLFCDIYVFFEVAFYQQFIV